MVEKKDGAEMTCKSCNTELICHMSKYKGDFKNKLQWQNEDGTAHYKFNGTEYSCNIPEETDPEEIMLNPKDEESQTTIHENATAYVVPVTLDDIKNEIKFQREILQSILHIVTDIKLKESKL